MSSLKSFPTLETQRLRLREMTEHDAADLFGYYSDREVTKYLDWFGPSSEEAAKRMIASWNEGFQEDRLIRWGITLKSDDIVIGTIIINPVRGPFRWKLPIVIGYELAQAYWNQGIMTEALRAVISYIFDGLRNHRICAEVFLENGASERILKKLGFQEEGIMRQHLWHEGYETWHDVKALALLKEDYVPTPPAPADRVPALYDYLNAMDRRGYLNGSVLVAHRGNVLVAKGFGTADAVHDIPNTPQTKFRIGSLSKGFTAFAIMQLQDQGLLHVDDPVANHLPDFPNGERITIHHLLTHTSGLYNYAATLQFWQNDMRLFSASIEDIIALFRDEPLAFAPGEDCAYSNAGYILLTAIIEKASGLSYADYMRTKVLQPLGMLDSGCDNGRTVVKGQASGYSVWKSLIHPEHEDMSKALGAYGLYATVEDLYRWDRALHTGELISSDCLTRMFTTYPDTYGGYGWFISNATVQGVTRKKISHLGDVGGYTAHIARYPDDELVVIFCSNMIITPVERITDDLARIALGENVQAPPHLPAIEVALSQLASLAGVYELRDMTVGPVIISYEDDRLYIEMAKRYGARYKYGMTPVGSTGTELTFVTDFVDELVRILPPDGEACGQLLYRDVTGTERLFIKK
ncbi:GNAT family N-acetyltransferase [Brevibacillus fluminis]|uniref:GNAT family N-acetyltransferase n=1 Tax=Brevibacillus fluminis TaxID=511487 RepID=UPI003F89AC49